MVLGKNTVLNVE